ncbi:sugar ABC transporter substrate-binding protein [Desulfotignum balticum]|uniref:sugar ABC transporter substrate-binding protein n=1 Tax=Desulfotignum balticum TaxID=115781 RepID=UPI0004624BE0|nr:sugar ABC transporter substrate-binding protein [Desulfotignum balticum]
MFQRTRALTIFGIAVLLTLSLVGSVQAKALVFGMTGRDMTPPYARAIEAGAEKKAHELGVKLLLKDSQNDILKQLSHIDSFIVMGVDAVLFEGTIDTRAIVRGIEKLNKKGIPIVALDNSPEGGKVAYWVSFDIEDASRKAAESFIGGIKAKHEGKIPEGVVLEITGALGDGFANDCTKGFDSVLNKYPGLTVVQGEGKWNNIDSFKRTSDLLTRYKGQIIGIYVHTPDIMGQGVVQAIETAGLNPADYSISGICMGPEGRELIKEGKIYSIVQQPAMASAEIGVQLLYDIVTGKTDLPKKGEILNVPNAHWSPAPIVDNPRCNGLMIKLNAPVVPQEVKADDPRLWENILTK